METAVKVWTDEELMALPKDGHKRELLEGEIIISPAGSEHGHIAVIDPAGRNARVHRASGAESLRRVTETLDGEDVLPGFRLPLAELFAELSFE
jgi:Uma2 family endonuclease